MKKLNNYNQLINRDEFLTPFDSIFDNMIQKAMPSFSQDMGIGFFGSNSYPKVDVLDFSEKIQIQAEIVGLSEKEVSVDLEENVLSISGSKQKNSELPNVKYIRKELKRSNFKRSFELNDNFNLKKIQANFKNGLLVIDIPKKEAEEPKKIKIL